MKIETTIIENRIHVTLDAEAYFSDENDIADAGDDIFTGIIDSESNDFDAESCIFECDLTSGPMLTLHGFYNDTMHIAHLPAATREALTSALS